MPYSKNHKYYSSATLQFVITNYQALMAKFNHTNYTKLISFIEHLPTEHREWFQTIVAKNQLLARTSLQTSLNISVAHSISVAVVMRSPSWLQCSGFPKEVQNTIDHVPFDCTKLFTDNMDESLHTLKDFGATLQSLGIYIPAQKRQFCRSQVVQRSYSAQFLSSQSLYEPHHKRQRFQRKLPNFWPSNFTTFHLEAPIFDGMIKVLSCHSLSYQLQCFTCLSSLSQLPLPLLVGLGAHCPWTSGFWRSFPRVLIYFNSLPSPQTSFPIPLQGHLLREPAVAENRLFCTCML